MYIVVVTLEICLYALLKIARNKQQMLYSLDDIFFIYLKIGTDEEMVLTKLSIGHFNCLNNNGRHSTSLPRRLMRITNSKYIYFSREYVHEKRPDCIKC